MRLKVRSLSAIVIICLAVGLMISAGPALAAIPPLPHTFTFTSFSDLDAFSPVNNAPFSRVQDPDGNWAYKVATGVISTPPGAGGEYKYAVMDYANVNEFTLELDARGATNNRAMVMIFGWQDPGNYYYAYCEPSATRVSRVVDGVEVTPYLFATGTWSWAYDSHRYHNAKLTVEHVDANTIGVKFYARNRSTPEFYALLPSADYTPGKVGFGAANLDTHAAYYDNIRLTFEAIYDPNEPYIYAFNNSSDASAFTPVHNAPFSVVQDPKGNHAYKIDTGIINIPSGSGGNFRYAIMNDSVESFELDLDMRGNENNMNVVLIYGWQNGGNYNYVYLTESADLSRVGRVVGGTLVTPYDHTISGSGWQSNGLGYQHIKLIVGKWGNGIRVKVFVNHEMAPIIDYSYDTSLYSPGRVGFGTYNSSIQSSFFDNVYLKDTGSPNPALPHKFTFSWAEDPTAFSAQNGSPFVRERDPDNNWAFKLQPGLITLGLGAGGNYRYAVMDYPDLDEFTLELDSRGATLNNNIVLIFGWQDPGNYYYAYLSSSASATRISRVVNGAEVSPRLYETGQSSWSADADNYKNIKLTVEQWGWSNTIRVKVYTNGSSTPKLSASLPAANYTPGKVGFGTWNSDTQSSYFDNIKLTRGAPYEVKASALIATGWKYLGTPYLLNSDPWPNSTNTFDCSSYAQWVFSQHGITLPRNTRQQWSAEIGTFIPGSSLNGANLDNALDNGLLRKGDLMFFTSTDRKDNVGIDRVGHVAIYIGDGMIIHSSGPVLTQPLTDLLKTYYLGAKRLITD